MANRTMGAVDGTSLFACSICGVPARFPDELTYTTDRWFVHSDGRHGKIRTQQEQDNWRRQANKPDHLNPRFPIGVKAPWQV